VVVVAAAAGRVVGVEHFLKHWPLDADDPQYDSDKDDEADAIASFQISQAVAFA
jgi:hypothetical protein